MNEVLYSFTFSNDKNRWPLWYMIALSILIWVVIWWFLTRQYVMSFLFILVAWVWFFIENNSEENTIVEINNLWIKINSQFYDYPKIMYYTVFYENGEAYLLRLTLNKKWLKYIDLKINNEIVLALNDILPKYIKQNEKSELEFVDKIINLLKL